MEMFCYQCEQTANGKGCTVRGVCGKDPEVSALIDLTHYAARGVSIYAHRARALGASDRSVDRAVVKALFSTVTNVNFDADRYVKILKDLYEKKETAKYIYQRACEESGVKPEVFSGAASWVPAANAKELIRQGMTVGIAPRLAKFGNDVTGLKELLTYGVMGMAAYVDHAQILGQEDDSVYAFIHEALNFLTEDDHSADELTAMSLKCGEVNLKVMALLDSANTGAYGDPVPTKVRTTPIKGKAILVSGHDLKDLEELLKQTEGRGINVYTHGEMLPAHGYPKLKKYKHLAGNYGGAWQDQQREFDAFPGSILMTTNCIQKPKDSYKGRIFTSGLVAWPGVTHIGDQNFSPVIEMALASPGFAEDTPAKEITVGFGHNAISQVAGAVVGAVKEGKIKRFFLIGGCDGAKSGRNYYTEFAERVPDDCVILTLACGKYRFNKLEFGDIGGIPRLIDCGQCNDAYTAIQTAVTLANAFGVGVNELPLSMILSWYEQKAVAILLTLLHLGIKDIRIGPSLPAFVTPAVLNVLVDKFNIMPIKTAQEDLKAILN